MITQVGTFQGSIGGLPLIEVVATTRPNPDEISVTDHASITFFDSSCHLLYKQEFPGAGEVTFETMDWDGEKLLHLATISAIGEPGDDTIINHIILAENYDGSFLPIQPSFLTANKSTAIFVGNIGKGKGYGIVETFLSNYGTRPNGSPQISVMFQFKDVQLSKDLTLTTFTGPTPIDVSQNSQMLNWPEGAAATVFPLTQFLLGD